MAKNCGYCIVHVDDIPDVYGPFGCVDAAENSYLFEDDSAVVVPIRLVPNPGVP